MHLVSKMFVLIKGKKLIFFVELFLYTCISFVVNFLKHFLSNYIIFNLINSTYPNISSKPLYLNNLKK